VAERSQARTERHPGLSRGGLVVGIVVVTLVGSGVVFLIGRFLR
jgi:hypothetical protein